MQLQEHLNSYDHHHRKRFFEMKQDMKGSVEEREKEREERQRREQRRQEKEMQKMLEKAGAGRVPAAMAPPAPAPKPVTLGGAPLKFGLGAKPGAKPVAVGGGGNFSMKLAGARPKAAAPVAKRPCVFQPDDSDED
mmetsp:Transcript_32877/g.77102  ORF Transcript_32877/g.77102 Transcript_32877/m.77102 type:complete len:136 (+) Transcript_32877:482-889(+)